MKTMAVSQFKAHALEEIDKVSTLRESIIITNRGKPVARLIPYALDLKRAVPGKLSEALVNEVDIVSPLGSELWDANK